MAHKTLTIIKWKVAGHGVMNVGRFGIRKNGWEN